MSPEVQAFVAGFLVTLLHAATVLAVLLAASATYVALSPHRELARVRQGNGAAALAFSGILLGLAAPLALSLASAPSVEEILLWGLAIAVVQLFVFRVIDLVLIPLPRRAMEGDYAAAGVLAAAKLGAALVLAAAVAG